MGLVFKVRLHIDAAAALGVIERRGVVELEELGIWMLGLYGCRSSSSER